MTAVQGSLDCSTSCQREISLTLALKAVLCLSTIAFAPAQGWPPSRAVPDGPADTLYYNGKIVTMWSERPVVESMTVRTGRITSVGITQVVGREVGPRTVQINLNGRTVVPGLIDSHVHPLQAALAEADGVMPVLESFDDIRAYIERRLAQVDGPVLVPNIYSTRLKEQRYPDRWELDSYSGDRPVVLDNGYAAVLNSAGLGAAGISASSPDPDNGRLVRDDVGEPTGLVVGARQLVAPLLRGRSYSHEESVAALEAMQRAYSAVGLTSVIDRSLTPSDLRAYQDLWRRGSLTVRTYATRTVNVARPLDQVLTEIESLGPVTGYGDDMFRIGALQVALDGGILAGAANMWEPYVENTEVYRFKDPVVQGTLRIRPDDLRQIVSLAASLGWQMTAHTTERSPTDPLLDVYEQVDSEVPIKGRRFSLPHANFLSGEAIGRAARLGVLADMQPAWYHFDGPALSRVLGPDRMVGLQPYRALFDGGVVVGGGSDHMIGFDSKLAVNPYDPFFGMWVAVSRVAADGSVHNPEQRVSREEALRMWTWNAAYLSFDEDVKGSLEPGKYADFVILDRDILTCPLEELRDTQVLETVLGGSTVYRGPKGIAR